MRTKSTAYFLVLIFSALLSCVCGAQNRWIDGDDLKNVDVDSVRLRENVEYLCDSICQGRALGTNGHADVTITLIRHFQKLGLDMISDSYAQSFPANGKVGHNVAGILRGGSRKNKTEAKKYIVVGAHYDHIGTIGQTLYPGADANASGVAVLMELITAFRSQRAKYDYPTDIIFVAFDGWCEGRSGAKAFISRLRNGYLLDPQSGQPILPGQIKAMFDIDQIGSNLAPVDPKKKDYIIAIGESSLPQRYHGSLNRCNWFYYCDLDIHTDYYGSKRFTSMFYHLGDRGAFIGAGIPTIYFTSGITKLNNSTGDTPDSLDYTLLSKRCFFIFRYIEKIL